jgi:hypothetical protein
VIWSKSTWTGVALGPQSRLSWRAAASRNRDAGVSRIKLADLQHLQDAPLKGANHAPAAGGVLDGLRLVLTRHLAPVGDCGSDGFRKEEGEPKRLGSPLQFGDWGRNDGG